MGPMLHAVAGSKGIPLIKHVVIAFIPAQSIWIIEQSAGRTDVCFWPVRALGNICCQLPQIRHVFFCYGGVFVKTPEFQCSTAFLFAAIYFWRSLPVLAHTRMNTMGKMNAARLPITYPDSAGGYTIVSPGSPVNAKPIAFTSKSFITAPPIPAPVMAQIKGTMES